jgi:hypothetical protein
MTRYFIAPESLGYGFSDPFPGGAALRLHNCVDTWGKPLPNAPVPPKSRLKENGMPSTLHP